MTILSNDDIRDELKGIRLLILPDARYAVVDSSWLRDSFLPWFKDWCLQSGLSYESEARDCDKFARAFVAQAQFSAWRRKNRVTGALGWMGVDDRGGHALNLVRTQHGWVEIEPQTGHTTPLRSDRRSVYYAVL